jgi:hypothetical protein
MVVTSTGGGNAIRIPRDQRAHPSNVSSQTLGNILEPITQPPDQDITDQCRCRDTSQLRSIPESTSGFTSSARAACRKAITAVCLDRGVSGSSSTTRALSFSIKRSSPKNRWSFTSLIFLPMPIAQAVLDKSLVRSAPAQHVQDPACLQRFTGSSTTVLGMAAVRKVIEPLDKLGPDRIQMNVAEPELVNIGLFHTRSLYSGLERDAPPCGACG